MICSAETKSIPVARFLGQSGVLLSVLVFATFAGSSAGLPASNNVNDFIAYWTAARQALGGHNP
jgi:hypothetical protein